MQVTYFVTTFPYVVLTTLLIYVSTLPGFSDGVHYYVTPDWEKLQELTVWRAAASQVLLQARFVLRQKMFHRIV